MAHGQTITQQLDFEDHRLIPLLVGDKERYTRQVAQVLDVTIEFKAGHLSVSGARDQVAAAQVILTRLYDRLSHGMVVSQAEVEATIRLVLAEINKAQTTTPGGRAFELSIPTRRYVVLPRTSGQEQYMDALKKHEMVFAEGPAGTGKTYLAVAMGVSLLLSGVVDRIILSRPVVEAGEHLGFLPGDIKEKVDPYLRPLYDALYDMLPGDKLTKRVERGDIEIAPLAFMRGRTLSRAYVILDEAQNTTQAQMKMFLTRLGEGSRMVITGDLSQIDLPSGVKSGLAQALSLLPRVDGVQICRLTRSDVVRHPLVARIVEAYELENPGHHQEGF